MRRTESMQTKIDNLLPQGRKIAVATLESGKAKAPNNWQNFNESECLDIALVYAAGGTCNLIEHVFNIDGERKGMNGWRTLMMALNAAGSGAAKMVAEWHSPKAIKRLNRGIDKSLANHMTTATGTTKRIADPMNETALLGSIETTLLRLDGKARKRIVQYLADKWA